MWVSYTGIVVNKPMLPAEPKQNVSIVFLLTVAGESWKRTHLIDLDFKKHLSLLMNVFVQITQCIFITNYKIYLFKLQNDDLIICRLLASSALVYKFTNSIKSNMYYPDSVN